MVTFVILRHGCSQFNREKRFTGQADVPLAPEGLAQAAQTSAWVLAHYRIDAVYASDLIRAVDTARPIAEALHLPIHTDPGLLEINAGFWQGQLLADLKRDYPEALARWHTDTGTARCGDGETMGELGQRAQDAMARIAAENDGKTVLVATHGGVIRALRCAWLCIPPERIGEVPHVSNGSVTVAVYDPIRHTATLPLIGYDAHLGDQITRFVIE